MRIFRSVLILSPVVVLCITSYAQAQDLSAQLLHAQYVAFGYETAQGFVSDSSMEALTSRRSLLKIVKP